MSVLRIGATPRHLVVLSLVVGALSWAWPLTSGGYVRSRTTKSGAPLTWMSSNCVYMRVNSNGSDDIKDGSDVVAAKRAIDNWRRGFQGCSYLRFQILEDSTKAEPGFTNEGTNENVIYWVEKDWERESLAAAITTVFYLDKPDSKQDGRILDADIELNGVTFHFGTTGSPGRTDVENTVAHELGHLMGLDHVCDDETRFPLPTDNKGKTVPSCSVAREDPFYADATMYNFADAGETKKRDPTADELQGICDIYPVSKDPGKCFAITYSDGCSMSGAPRLGIWPLGLLGLVLVVRRCRRSRRSSNS